MGPGAESRTRCPDNVFRTHPEFTKLCTPTCPRFQLRVMCILFASREIRRGRSRVSGTFSSGVQAADPLSAEIGLSLASLQAPGRLRECPQRVIGTWTWTPFGPPRPPTPISSAPCCLMRFSLAGIKLQTESVMSGRFLAHTSLMDLEGV